MQASFPALERTDRTTERVPKHALRCNKLVDELLVIDRAPMSRLSRYRRQQAKRAPEPTAQLRRTSYRSRDVARAIGELPADAAAQRPIENEKVLA
jgi:hypothetical protein